MSTRFSYKPQARWVDLLKADEFRRYISRPELLRPVAVKQIHGIMVREAF